MRHGLGITSPPVRVISDQSSGYWKPSVFGLSFPASVPLQPKAPLVAFNGKKVQSVKSAWRKLRTDLQLDDDVQPYGIRHTMARWMRKSGVPAWEVAAQLGHKTPGVTTTEIYAPFDPDYLRASTDAIDAFLQALACELRASPISDFLIGRLDSLKNKGKNGAPKRIRTFALDFPVRDR